MTMKDTTKFADCCSHGWWFKCSDFIGTFLPPYMGVIPNPKNGLYFPNFMYFSTYFPNFYDIFSSDGPMIDYSRKSVGLGFRLRQSIVK